MEFVKAFDIPNAETVAAGASGIVEREISIPPTAETWSVQVVPKNVASGNDPPTLTVQYGVGSEYFGTNPPTSSPAVLNTVNVVTRLDPLSRVKVRLTNPGNASKIQDGDTLVRLYISRK